MNSALTANRHTDAAVVMTAGEPAGIGPDLALAMAKESFDGEFVVLGDRNVLGARARQLGLDVEIRDACGNSHVTGGIDVEHIACESPVVAGQLDVANAQMVMHSIEQAIDYCVSGRFDAMVTGPLQKSVIIDAGFKDFQGHTEFLAQRTGASMPVMLLASDDLRVALVTTHLPLSKVSAAVTPERLEAVVRVLEHDLRHTFGLASPVISVCGLNPHAGESGHLGREEIEVIEPALDRLRAQGLELIGPVPADTAFTPGALKGVDAVLAMYHDQGLPVLKHHGFERAVNVTLGLPIIRTSVDHGTALDLAGSGHADSGSLVAATRLAFDLASRRRQV